MLGKNINWRKILLTKTTNVVFPFSFEIVKSYTNKTCLLISKLGDLKSRDYNTYLTCLRENRKNLFSRQIIRYFFHRVRGEILEIKFGKYPHNLKKNKKKTLFILSHTSVFTLLTVIIQKIEKIYITKIKIFGTLYKVIWFIIFNTCSQPTAVWHLFS